MNMVPTYPLSSNKFCSCGSPFLDNDIKISSVTKEVTQCMTAVTAIAGFNNYHDLKDEDKQYLYNKISTIINSLNDLKDIFQVKEETKM